MYASGVTSQREREKRGKARAYLPQIAIQKAGEAKGAGGPTHGGGDEVVEIPVGGVDQFERAQANVVKCLGGIRREGGKEKGPVRRAEPRASLPKLRSKTQPGKGGAHLVVKNEALVSVFDELVHGKHGVIRLHHRVRDLGRKKKKRCTERTGGTRETCQGRKERRRRAVQLKGPGAAPCLLSPSLLSLPSRLLSPCMCRPSQRVTLAEGMTAYELTIRSGNSSFTLDMRRVPRPDPVPPLSECVI